jgi:hypothetical protein
MEKVVIPFNFEELAPAEQNEIVPICLSRQDREGKKIAWRWFEATRDIQWPLRALAKRALDDVWRVSELADMSVQTVWTRYGTDFGRSPEMRIYAEAKWCAKDLRSGTHRERRGKTVALEDLDFALRNRALVDPIEYEDRYMAGIDLAEWSKRLEIAGDLESKLILDHLRDGRNWDEVGDLTGRSANSAQRRFWRQVSEILSTLTRKNKRR